MISASKPKVGLAVIASIALSSGLFAVLPGCSKSPNNPNGTPMQDAAMAEGMMQDGMMKDGTQSGEMMKEGMMKDGMMKDAAPDMKSDNKM